MAYSDSLNTLFFTESNTYDFGNVRAINLNTNAVTTLVEWTNTVVRVGTYPMAIALQPGKNCLFVVCARDTTGGTVASKFYVINILCDGSSGGAAASGGGGLTDDEVAVAAGFSAVLGTASLLGLIQIARWAFNHFGAKSKTEAAAHTGTSSLARCFRYPGARRRSGDEEEEEVVVARSGVKGLTSSSVGGKTPHTPKTPTAPKPASPPRSPPRERNFVRVNMADDLNPAASHFSVAPHTGL